MSDTDSFIDEVTEEVRRDRLFAAMRRYGWIGVVLVLLIVGGAAWREYTRATAAAEAQAFGDAILSALDADAGADRAAVLSAINAPGAETEAVLAMLIAAESGDDAEATARLSAVATNGDLPEIYRQIASFKALTRPDQTMDAAQRRVAFEAMAQPGKPLRLLAEEQLALIEIETGDADAAISRLTRILSDAEASSGLRRRATQLIVALGGDLSAS